MIFYLALHFFNHLAVKKNNFFILSKVDYQGCHRNRRVLNVSEFPMCISTSFTQLCLFSFLKALTENWLSTWRIMDDVRLFCSWLGRTNYSPLSYLIDHLTFVQLHFFIIISSNRYFACSQGDNVSIGIPTISIGSGMTTNESALDTLDRRPRGVLQCILNIYQQKSVVHTTLFVYFS